jgi:hypothetical protein
MLMGRAGIIRMADQIRDADGSARNDKLSLYSTNVLLRMILIFKNSTNVLLGEIENGSQ